MDWQRPLWDWKSHLLHAIHFKYVCYNSGGLFTAYLWWLRFLFSYFPYFHHLCTIGPSFSTLFLFLNAFYQIKGKKQYLQIIVMSATMDVDHFSDYFGRVPILYLEGRQYPVQVYHASQTQEDFVFSCLVTVFQIHKEAPAKWVMLHILFYLW